MAPIFPVLQVFTPLSFSTLAAIVFKSPAQVSPFTLTINAVTGYLSVTSGNPRTLVTTTIVLTDSGNAIDVAILSLDFTPGEFDPTEFNLDFNL